MKIGKNLSIGVIGLGYVGLPLLIEFNKKFRTVGFDISKKRIHELKKRKDFNQDITKGKIKKKLNLTNNVKDIENLNIYIVTVPTPLTKAKKPDLSHLKHATKIISKVLKRNDVVVYESTVYPGATEEVLVPILEKKTKLQLNKDFFVGYSPERISPGDKKHTLNKITKIVSASNKKTAVFLSKLYSSIIKPGTYVTTDIKTAEAAKIVENVQRDLNISLMNELSIIFNKMNIDTSEVIKAASTKWNFMKFKPGIVGGHCIRVDPYYLTSKSLDLGYRPNVISSGRKINENMGLYVAKNIIKIIKKKKLKTNKIKIGIMGLGFKENCGDIRNSQVFNIIEYLERFNCKIFIEDPFVNPKLLSQKFRKKFSKKIRTVVNVLVFAVAHDDYKKLSISNIKRKLVKDNPILIDLKSIFNAKSLRKNNIFVWKL